MIVVDTNIIAHLFLAGPHSAVAEQLLLKDHDWAAPLLWRSEFRNVLAGTIRRGHLTVAAAGEIMRGAEALLQRNEYAVTSDHVLRLVAESDCSAYDCELVALAEDLAVPLVTADSRILAGFPTIAVAPTAFI
jgi:predicted nucleic acid-binding protein